MTAPATCAITPFYQDPSRPTDGIPFVCDYDTVGSNLTSPQTPWPLGYDQNLENGDGVDRSGKPSGKSSGQMELSISSKLKNALTSILEDTQEGETLNSGLRKFWKDCPQGGICEICSF
jgi:hypothetical protein